MNGIVTSLAVFTAAALGLCQTPEPAPPVASAPVPKVSDFAHFVTLPDGRLEMRTAAQRLVAEGKPVIWLVGAIHVGSKEYYSAIQRLLNYDETVFYEGVRANANSPSMAERYKRKNGSVMVYTTLSKAIGLDFQAYDIDYTKPNWVNVDLTLDDLNKLSAKESGGKPSEFTDITSILTPGSPMAKQFAFAMQSATPGMKEAIKLMVVKEAGGDAMSLLEPATQRILIDARNKAVTDKLAATLAKPNPPRSIGIFYGAGHLPGLQNTLVTQYGYHLDEKRWFAAAVADPKKVDAMGKMVLDAFEKAMASRPKP